MDNNLVAKNAQNQSEKDLEKKIKGIIQEYNNRLINNQLSTSNQQNH